MFRRSKSTYAGWTKVAKGRYLHVDGFAVVKKGYHWEIVGGKNDGQRYGPLWVALYYANKTPAQWA